MYQKRPYVLESENEKFHSLLAFKGLNLAFGLESSMSLRNSRSTENPRCFPHPELKGSFVPKMFILCPRKVKIGSFGLQRLLYKGVSAILL